MKEHTNRCVLIMPYFGRLPSCLGTYLASLRGKNFDVLWISDLPVREHPDNFKIVHMTFDECRARMADRLGVPVCINGGYRLCDFKPMYGQVFEDLISDYDYWGFGDCDLVYGRAFNDFLKRTVETDKYDVISMQAEYLSGPTCFLRNNERMRTLYRKARDWESVCAWNGSRVLNFDECGGMFYSQLKAGTMTMEDCSRIHDSFAAVIWREPNLNFYHENVIDECNLRNGEVIEMQGGGGAVARRHSFGGVSFRLGERVSLVLRSTHPIRTCLRLSHRRKRILSRRMGVADAFRPSSLPSRFYLCQFPCCSGCEAVHSLYEEGA